MSEYVAPLKDRQFILQEISPVGAQASLPAFEEVTFELATAILEEASTRADWPRAR